ncbi:possible cysteine desulfurase (chromatophore) [Paulinella micropora]|uniref:cysteine desulfurase n=1 Tax=Paulinella micropora TaxID=1928728 RepID=A0A1L5YB73_9EUKA|nr:putative cysteine desulfurase or selenocysteine lyase [Paulinella micropora]AQX44714.1 putative cysteine desulfurase or selenocysteine lyase [Paulinella micropora]BBL85924.1 possible cysteine desulfurase [Paulinella micropora]
MQRVTSGLIYLDASATSPPSPEVLQMMCAAHLEGWGNPSSLHLPGLKAAELLERSRQVIASSFNATMNEIILCSGGTESIQLALLGTAALFPPSESQLVISAVEHPAVTAAAKQLSKQGWTIKVWPVNRQGQIRLEYTDELLGYPTRLVSIVWGQSEVGTLQPVRQIGQICHERGILFHTDAVQVVGHEIIEWSKLPIDLLSFASHKFQGPRGIGGLLHRSVIPCQSQMNGGGQEHGFRSGTEPVPLVVGLATALELVTNRLLSTNKGNPFQLWRDKLLNELLSIPGIELTGHPSLRLPYHISIICRTKHNKSLLGRALVKTLDNQGLAISSGTACSNRENYGSYVLKAMGYSEDEALTGLRLTLGPWHDFDTLHKIPSLLRFYTD